jgi:hypothetical protein
VDLVGVPPHPFDTGAMQIDPEGKVLRDEFPETLLSVSSIRKRDEASKSAA